MKRAQRKLRIEANEHLKQIYGITAAKDPLWTGQLAAGFSMLPTGWRKIGEKYRVFRYSKRAIYKGNGNWAAPDFDGLKEFEKVVESVGAVGIAAHAWAAVVYFPDGDAQKMVAVGKWCHAHGAQDDWNLAGTEVFVD